MAPDLMPGLIDVDLVGLVVHLVPSTQRLGVVTVADPFKVVEDVDVRSPCSVSPSLESATLEQRTKQSLVLTVSGLNQQSLDNI